MFFIKNKEENNFGVSEVIQHKNKETNKNNMLEDLKVNNSLSINIEYEEKEIMENLTKNPELLENFSND